MKDEVNYVSISGNIGKVEFAVTHSGNPVCNFQIASDRRSKESTVTAWAKVNVYSKSLVEVCRIKLRKGLWVLVEGELMNREGKLGELTEIRARKLLFGNEREGVGHGS